MIKLIVLLSLSIPVFAKAPSNIIDKVKSEKTYENRIWHNLLHYKSSLFGGVSSEADSDTFFFAKDGADNPQSELIETLNAFYSKTVFKENEHPSCKFPARAKFLLKKKLITKKEIAPNCIKFENYKKKVSAKSISIVFSSYFLDTPASAFGHTLMRLNKNIRNTDKEDRNFELLDYAINYSATVTTDNALLYGVMGLAGGFRGEFASMPYFYKVREYNDFESRDLWSYDLNLNQEEIDMVVAHIWEMGQTFFRYFYLTENCSYHMLGLLDVANENWRLTERNPKFVIPVDTIKVLSETPGLVRRISYRPSKMRIAKKSVQSLNEKERGYFKEVISSKSPKAVSHLDNQQKAKILDASIDYLDFYHSEDILLEKPEALEWKRNLLISRSETKVRSKNKNPIKPPMDQRPDKGHGSRRFTLGAGESKSSGVFESLSYRFALHDFYDRQSGQNPQATMEMIHFKLNYYNKDKLNNNDGKLKLDFLDVVNVISIAPIERFFSNVSWRFKLGTRMIQDSGCQSCQSPTMHVGGGTSFLSKYFKSYFFITSEADLHKELSHNGFRLGVGPEGEVIFSPFDGFNLGVFGDYKWRWPAHVDQTYTYGSRLRYTFLNDIAINLDYKRLKKNWISEAGLFIYF
jgi:hypothetical protein